MRISGLAMIIPMAMLLASTSLPSLAADDASQAEIDAGRALAEKWCQRCHVIARENQQQALAGVPSFPSLADSGLDEGGLALALFNPHPPMPQFNLSRRDVHALAAYIGTLGE